MDLEYEVFSAKTVDDAITEACQAFGVTSDALEIEVIEKGSAGILGIGAKQAVINAAVKKVELPASDFENQATAFLKEVFEAMDMVVVIETSFDQEESTLSINLTGDDMGVLIGRRGQTLDSLQYLVSLVVNKGTEEYIRVKVDTENYRERRKSTLENVAKSTAYKVKRSKRSISLEPMNPYERRIIHSALQNDKYVTTHSEGEEPYRHVVVTLKKYEHYDRPRYNKDRR